MIGRRRGHRTRAPVRAAVLGLAAAGLSPTTGEPASALEAFDVQAIALDGRVVQADLADLDGDGRGDLLCIRASGMPPRERREVHVFYQRPDGAFPASSDWSAVLPDGAAAYDLAAVDARPGDELILLRRDRLTLLSWAGREPTARDLPIGVSPTIAVVADERGVDRLRIATRDLAGELRLLAPGLGWTAVLTPTGEVVGRLDVGGRANFHVPKQPGPVVSESEVEIYFDHPRILVGDVDGDGRGDIVSGNRHELRVFLQDEEGRFPGQPSQQLALGRLAPEDHVRNSGSVRVDGADLDGDGRLDLLISTSAGSLFDATTQLAIHLNRGSGWDLEQPDQEFRGQRGLTGSVVIDLDGDGVPELIQARIPTGVLEIVEVLVTRAIDADVAIHRRGDGSLFGREPWQRWKLGVGISFETFRPTGFVPTLEADFNGDGLHDLLGSGGGKHLEVNLGHKERGWGTRHARQRLDTGGRVRFGHLDADGLTDFVLYDPRRPGTPVRVGANRGVLPGTRHRPSLAPLDAPPGP